MNIEKTFNSRRGKPLFNTSYPLSPKDWDKYRVSTSLSFDKEKEVSFYVHIPFCKQLCSFCEYTRMVCPDEDLQRKYITTIDRDVSTFVSQHGMNLKLRGFDIGGGTPTALSDKNLYFLLQTFIEAIDWMDISEDFEPSIEGTFDTITERKAELIVGAGINRISLGVQSSSNQVLNHNHRKPTDPDTMKDVMNLLYSKGIRKINLDLMYGLKGQNIADLEQDLKMIAFLNPEQVTLYELRTNMIPETPSLSADELFEEYSYLYRGLTQMGYYGRFGQNTFSKDSKDQGVSSYLRSRMLEGTAYKGFGISAQSMCNEGIAYNIGKLSGPIKGLIGTDTFEEEFTYHLPAREIASKYIAIGAYNGSFSLDRLSEMLGCDSRLFYSEPLEYCLANELITIENSRVFITAKGFRNYGAVFSLFYANDHED